MAIPLRGGDDDSITDINVTPLVDVTLILLVVLLLAATQLVASTIPIDLPHGTCLQGASNYLAVAIDERGAIDFDGEIVTLDRLRTIAEAAKRTNDDTSAIIVADGRTSHAQVVAVVDTLREANVTRFVLGIPNQSPRERGEPAR